MIWIMLFFRKCK